MPEGFARIAAVSLPVHLGDVEANEREIMLALERLRTQGVQAAVFPELCLTGYTLGDLLLHGLVQDRAWAALKRLKAHTDGLTAVVGLPFCHEGRLYNCAAVLANGEIWALVPKTYLPNGNEFYETRWFASGAGVHETVSRDGLTFPLSVDTLFAMGGFVFGVELCEDLWVPLPPSSHLAVEGADLILNPSASNALAAKHAYRRGLLSQQSGRLYAGYAYAGAGFGESTSDMVFDGYTGVFENGRALSEAALGFCTYNGDHMSMYNVNCSVPKTLVKSLVWHLGRCFGVSVASICQDVIATPISPELLPTSQGELQQRTEDILGDYALHDFFLYHLMDSGASAGKLKMLAMQAFHGVYGEARVEAQLKTFLRRFFAQQFKRNCVPDGPKVGSVSLSPRGDWRMPSDMQAGMWLDF